MYKYMPKIRPVYKIKTGEPWGQSGQSRKWFQFGYKATVINLETSIGTIENNTSDIKGMMLTESKMNQIITAAVVAGKSG